MVQWVGAQVAATTVWLTSNRQLEGTIGRVADTAHMGSFTTRRSHLNLLWIYIVLSTPMIYKLCRFISRSNMESLKPTPRVTFETRGLRWHDSANLASFSKFKNPRTMEGRITQSRRLLLYWWKFKDRRKISGLESIWQLYNPGSKKFRVIRNDSGLQFGLRKIYSPTKLWSSQIRFKNVRFKKESTSRKFEFKGHKKIPAENEDPVLKSG